MKKRLMISGAAAVVCVLAFSAQTVYRTLTLSEDGTVASPEDFWEANEEDIADALSLGTAATANSSSFATAAQGAKADTAVQPNTRITVPSGSESAPAIQIGDEGGIYDAGGYLSFTSMGITVGYFSVAGLQIDVGDISTGGWVLGSGFRGGNGSSSLPSFSFASDPDTGMYREGSNLLSFAAGGSTVFRLYPYQITANQPFQFAGNSYNGVAKIYDNTNGDRFGMEQLGGHQTGDVAQFRLFTSGVGGAYIQLGRYTDESTWDSWLSLRPDGMKSTKRLELPEGSVTEPALWFGDPNTGLYGEEGRLWFANDGVITAGTTVNGFNFYKPSHWAYDGSFLQVGGFSDGRYFYGHKTDSVAGMTLLAGGNWEAEPFEDGTKRTGLEITLGDPSGSLSVVSLMDSSDVWGAGSDFSSKEFRVGSFSWSGADVVLYPGEVKALVVTPEQITANLPIYLKELAAPPPAPTEGAVLFSRDDGGGKAQLVVRFPTGAVQVIATEP